MHSDTLEDRINSMLARLEEKKDTAREEETAASDPQSVHVYDMYIEADRITVIRKDGPTGAAPDDTITVESPAPAPAQEESEQPVLSKRERTQLGSLTLVAALVLLMFSLLWQIALIVHAPTATITLVPTSQTLTFSGTLQLGRVLPPITLSQSQIVQATGHGHQDARAASGFITLYNGSLTPQTLHAGTVLTGNDGSEVVTDETVTIPANEPPVDGQARVRAHAMHTGNQGNIAAGDINLALSSVILARNRAAFRGGQDARDYPYVTQTDLSTAVALLTTAVRESMRGAFQGQVQRGEGLHLLPCHPGASADHVAGEEAATVTVTVALTCSGVAYNEQILQASVTQLLARQAVQQLGTGYTLLGNAQVTVTQAILTPNTRVLLAFSSSGTWVYGLPSGEQQRVKTLVAGKTKHEALQLLHRLPGIQAVTITLQGGTSQTLPQDPRSIHLLVLQAGS